MKSSNFVDLFIPYQQNVLRVEIITISRVFRSLAKIYIHKITVARPFLKVFCKILLNLGLPKISNPQIVHNALYGRRNNSHHLMNELDFHKVIIKSVFPELWQLVKIAPAKFFAQPFAKVYPPETCNLHNEWDLVRKNLSSFSLYFKVQL